jgi:hypothetical protein
MSGSREGSVPSNKIDFDTVRRFALELPDVEESTAYGSPALKVRGKLLACIPVHRSAEPDSLAVRIDFDHRAELLAAAPDIYYLTDHYVNYAAVLVRLSRIHPDALRDLLGMAWRFVTAKTPSPKRTARKARALDRGRIGRSSGIGGPP